MGFLKKLPQFPITLGSGSLLCLICFTKSEIFFIVGFEIFSFEEVLLKAYNQCLFCD